MLALSVGQFSSAGEKSRNQDCHGTVVPGGAALVSKGAVAAIADGISSSDVSHIASETAVKTFLQDYFCTSDAWRVEHAGRQILAAVNRWLYAQSRHLSTNGEKDRGYVCTFSAVVFKHRTAYLFHAGDARIYRLNCQGQQPTLEQLTRDHRVWREGQKSYLSNALGMYESVQLDVSQVPLHRGDYFILATDGVYECLPRSAFSDLALAQGGDLDREAEKLVRLAFDNGSNDNLTVQLLRIDELPQESEDLLSGADTLPVPAVLNPGDELDGYRVSKVLHSSARSHVYQVRDTRSQATLVLKAPSVEMASSDSHLEQLLMEEWIARRVHSHHVVSAPVSDRPRSALYTVSEWVSGQTLDQWLRDQAPPSLETVREVIEQVAKGLQALHRSDIIHQDLRPENLMVDPHGAVTIIDLGAACIGGVEELKSREGYEIPGTAMYRAPEFFLGAGGTPQSDQYSLAVLTYYMLTGEYPYGGKVARCHTEAEQHKLRYRSVLNPAKAIPMWVDDTLRKATHPNPLKRYPQLSEFIYDLRYPNPKYLRRQRPPLLERNPLRFWQGVSGVLLLLVCALIIERVAGLP